MTLTEKRRGLLVFNGIGLLVSSVFAGWFYFFFLLGAIDLWPFVTDIPVDIPSDRETGRARGFAFVEMESSANEDKAIQALDGAEWMDRQLKVNKAKPREDRSSFGGGRRNNRF